MCYNMREGDTMGKKSSIDKLDAQIKKLKKNDDTNTPFLNRRELDEKMKLDKLKKKEKDKIKTSTKTKTKTLKLDEIKKALEKDNKKTNAKKSINGDKKSKRFSKTLIKNNYLDKKSKVNEVLDDEKEVDKIIRFLTKFFIIFLVVFVIIFIFICII